MLQVPTSRRSLLQVYACIDDRECSFRRHLEEIAPAGEDGEGVETFGVAGVHGQK
jgi:uncharacterized protein